MKDATLTAKTLEFFQDLARSRKPFAEFQWTGRKTVSVFLSAFAPWLHPKEFICSRQSGLLRPVSLPTCSFQVPLCRWMVGVIWIAEVVKPGFHSRISWDFIASVSFCPGLETPLLRCVVCPLQLSSLLSGSRLVDAKESSWGLSSSSHILEVSENFII